MSTIDKHLLQELSPGITDRSQFTSHTARTKNIGSPAKAQNPASSHYLFLDTFPVPLFFLPLSLPRKLGRNVVMSLRS